MKKLLKVLAAVAAAFLLVLAAAALYIKIKFPPERIKALVVAEAQKTLHRQLEVGSVRFGMLSGLRIEGVRLSEKPDFKAGEFLAADAFVFRFAWAPLLRKKLVAHEVALEGLRATLTKRKDGTLNVSDLEGGPRKADAQPEPGAAGTGAAGALALQVDSIRLKDAKFKYVDKGVGSEASLGIPLAKVEDFKLSGKFRFSVETELEYRAGKERRKAEVEAKGTMELAGGAQERLEADVEQLSVRSGGATLSGKLNLKNGAAPKLEGEFKSSALDSKTLAALAGAAVPDGLQLPAMVLSFSASSAGKTLSVPSFKLETAGLSLTGKLEIPDTKAQSPRIELQAASNTFEFGPLLEIHPLTRGKGLTGNGSFKLTARGKVEAPDVPWAELHLELAAIKPETLRALAPVPVGIGLPAMKLDVSASKVASTLELRSVALAAGDLRAKVSGRVAELDAKEPSLRLSLETETIPFTAFAPYISGITNLRGKARLVASAEGKASAPKVEGTMDLEGAGAEFLGQKLEQFTGAVRFTETSVDIPKLTGRVNGGDLALKLSAANPKAPVVTLQGTLTVLDAGALEALMATTPGAPPASEAAKPPPYTGPVLRTTGLFAIDKITHPNFTSGKASLQWDLTGVTPEFKLMDGTAKVRVGSGKAVKLLKLAKEKGGIARAMVAPLEALDKARGLKIPGLNVPPLEEIPFDKIEGDYAFQKGVMTMRPSLFDGPTLRAETNGTVDLPASKLDLKIAMRVSGLGNVELTARGPMDDPTVRPDLAKVENKLQEKGKELLKEQGKKLLKQFLK